MSWDRKDADFIGTSTKFSAAEKMRQATADAEKNAPLMPSSQLIPVAIVFALAAGVAAMMNGPVPFIGPTGIGAIDAILQGATPQGSSDADVNQVLFIMVRAGALFLMAGIVPLIARIILRLFGHGRVNALVACWMATLAAPLLYLLIKGSF